MADKEAIVFVIDLGATMAHSRSGRDESDLDWAMRFVWSKLGDMAASGRKTLCAGVVAFRTDGTDNHMQDESGYENITVLHKLGPVTLQTIRDMRGAVRPRRGDPSGGGDDPGDAVSAVVVAVDLMDVFTKKLKWLRRIYLVTDGRGQIDTDGVEAIGQKIKQSDIRLTVLGLDFDDAEYGFKEEDKDPAKARNEKHLRDLVALCDNGSQLATLAEAIESLDVPTVKQVRPYKSYDGPLTLGDPDHMPCAVTIYVERYFKTHKAIPVSATTVAVKGDGDGSGGEGAAATADEVKGGAGFAGVKNSRTYRVSDPAAPGGKRDVDFESLAKGYEYGRTAVHISESEHNVTKLESAKGFTIVGFMLKEKFEPFFNMGEAGIVVARRKDLQSQLALSSLVWALDELDSYAVARIVGKEGRDPVLVVLVPCIEPGFEALYDLALPFAEDVRSYQFPPLDRIVTVSGATVTTGHRLLPGDELAEAMDEYVDAMDLSEGGGGGAEGEGEGEE